MLCMEGLQVEKKEEIVGKVFKKGEWVCLKWEINGEREWWFVIGKDVTHSYKIIYKIQFYIDIITTNLYKKKKK